MLLPTSLKEILLSVVFGANFYIHVSWGTHSTQAAKNSLGVRESIAHKSLQNTHCKLNEIVT